MEKLEEIFNWYPEGDINVQVKSEGLNILAYEVDISSRENSKSEFTMLGDLGQVSITPSEIDGVEPYEYNDGESAESGFRILMKSGAEVTLFELKEV